MKLFTLFCFISVFVFSQTDKRTIFLQATFGSTHYSNPSATTSGACPTAELFLISNTNKKDSSKIGYGLLTGLGYMHATQVYNVRSSLNQNYTDNFITNEFSFYIGGSLRANINENMYLDMATGVQIGSNYTFTNDPNASAGMYKIVSTTSPQAIYTFLTNQTKNYTTVLSSTTYKWEYYQFYAFGKVQIGLNIAKRLWLVGGVSCRVFFYENNISEEWGMTKFNYAPLKLTVTAGLQLKLFK